MMDGMAMETFAAAGFEGALEIESGVEELAPRAFVPGLAGLPFEAFLNPVELRLARKLVDGLEPRDPQEEIHCWHLAASHLLAAQRIGKSRQDGLSHRVEQIEVGLAVRIMTLADRKSASLDRHCGFRQRTAERAERVTEKAARAAEAAARKQAREAEKAAEIAAPEERIAAHTRDREARRQERLVTAGVRSDAVLPSPTEEAVAPGSVLVAGPGSVPGADSGLSPEAACLSRQQRRALARREKKEARRLAGMW